ncbi:putative cytochrome P450 [Chaetomium strumarium]|uniref:Cytochrome P450 n=1 Tax=Chaetomium strumarium TaxID=1170767 RepID=A0AAJ0H102_9PEZI|nr:putative cytochrome P450 [Chaetomium strumarium]
MAGLIPLACVACVLLLVYWVSGAAYNLFLHPLRRYPGPRHWAATRLFLTASTLRGRAVHEINAMHRRYGHVVRIAPDQLSYTDERAWRDICGVTRAAPLGMRKDDRLNDLVGGHATNPDPSKHKADMQHTRMRRALAPAFTMASLRQQVPLVMRHVDELVALLMTAAREGRPVDMGRLYTFTLYDIFSDLFLGESFHLLSDAALHQWASSMVGFAKATTALAALSHFPLARLVIRLLLKFAGAKSRDAFMNPCFDRFERRAAQGSKGGTTGGRCDVVHFVLESRNSKQQVTEKELRDFSPFLMIGGGETMASLMPCLTYLLLKHPDVYQRLTSEIRGADFASDATADLTVEGILRLPYLGACIDEALRMYPPVPHGNERVVPAGGASVCGDRLPEGTIVVVSQLSTYRQKRNWFRPDSFLPEMWLPGAATEFAQDCHASFKPFLVGPQGCVGQELANLTMRLILSKLLLNFDLELEPESDMAWQADLPVYNVWIKPPLRVQLTRCRG